MSSENNLQDIQDEIEKLITAPRSNKDLLVSLGEIDGALFASPGDKEKRGLRFLRNALEKVQDTLCSNEFIRANGQDASMKEKALAVAAVVDFLGAKGAATAGLLIIQIGLEKVCTGRWEQHVK